MNPPKPTGTSAEARFAGWVWESIIKLLNIRIFGFKRESNVVGLSFVPDRSVRSGAGEIEPPIVQYRVKSVSENHLVCREWDGVTETEEDVFIAKPSEFRRSTWDGETIEVAGKEHEYTYTGAQSRTDRTASKDWPQIILPAYDTDCIIYAAEEVEGGTGVTVGEGESAEEITRVDLNVDGRSWATRIPYCDTGTAKYFYAVGSAPQLP